MVSKTMIQIFFFLSLLGLLVEPVLGYWRMDCMGIAGIARIDPIVTPGKISAHVHSIKGASGLSDSTTVEQLLASNCTSCPILQDKSAYWTPQMYFHDKTNDSYELVPEVPGHAVYYKYVTAVLNDGKGKTVTDPEPIPNGMRMISGNPFRRNSTVPFPDPPQPWSGDQVTQDALEQKAIGFNCLNYKNPKPEDTCYRHFLPDKAFLDANCPDGLRLEIVFPICWNGKDLDSDDHKSHLAYSSAGINGGNCPSGYDHVINQILLETIIPVGNYRDRQGEFTLANGDPTGHGFHGDAFIAWEDGVLEQANKQCGDPTKPPLQGDPKDCPVFKLQSAEDQASCKLESLSQKGQGKFKLASGSAVDGPLEKLPGDNPLYRGPEPAPLPKPDGAPAVPGSGSPSFDKAPPVPPAGNAPGSDGASNAPPNNVGQQANAPPPALPVPAAPSSTTTTTMITPPPVADPAGPAPAAYSTTVITEGHHVNVVVYAVVGATTVVTVSAPAPAVATGVLQEAASGPDGPMNVGLAAGKRDLEAQHHQHVRKHVHGAARHNHQHGHRLRR